MRKRLLLMLTLGVWLIQPPLSAGELSENDLRMKERLTALSRGEGSVADLRFRFHYKNLPPVDYRCDIDEYETSPQRSAIRSALLTFVSNSSLAEGPGIR